MSRLKKLLVIVALLVACDGEQRARIAAAPSASDVRDDDWNAVLNDRRSEHKADLLLPLMRKLEARVAALEAQR